VCDATFKRRNHKYRDVDELQLKLAQAGINYGEESCSPAQ